MRKKKSGSRPSARKPVGKPKTELRVIARDISDEKLSNRRGVSSVAFQKKLSGEIARVRKGRGKFPLFIEIEARKSKRGRPQVYRFEYWPAEKDRGKSARFFNRFSKAAYAAMLLESDDLHAGSGARFKARKRPKDVRIRISRFQRVRVSKAKRQTQAEKLKAKKFEAASKRARSFIKSGGLKRVESLERKLAEAQATIRKLKERKPTSARLATLRALKRRK